MNYKITKIKLIIWLVIFIAMTSFVVYGFMRLDSVRISTGQMEREIIQEKESIHAFDALVKSYSNIKEESEKTSAYFIKEEEIVDFLDNIEALAKVTNTKISIQTVSDKNTASSSSLLSVDINARGSYSNLHYLLRILEELPYLTEIQSVRFVNGTAVDEKARSSISWTADITIVGVMY
jgi:hypothetical protein